MKFFAVSDLHFGHENIIRYCSRPFANSNVMNRELIARWNNRVAPLDIVYFLGDFAMGPGVDRDFILSVLEQLNGILFVVLGNHDEPNKKYAQDGLKRIIREEELPITILDSIHEDRIDGQKFVMCHYPMKDWPDKHKGAIHLHGHVHTQFSPSRARRMAAEKRYDVGVDMYGGPVQISGDLRYLNDPKGWEL